MIDEKKLIDELKQNGMIADNEYGNAMLDIINSQPQTGDKMMSPDDTIEFFMRVSQILDDCDAETDKEFPERYTQAMNRLRYERDKSRGVPVKRIKKKHGSGHFVRCGNCGSECINGNPHYHYCPNCGYAVKGY